MVSIKDMNEQDWLNYQKDVQESVNKKLDEINELERLFNKLYEDNERYFNSRRFKLRVKLDKIHSFLYWSTYFNIYFPIKRSLRNFSAFFTVEHLLFEIEWYTTMRPHLKKIKCI